MFLAAVISFLIFSPFLFVALISPDPTLYNIFTVLITSLSPQRPYVPWIALHNKSTIASETNIHYRVLLKLSNLSLLLFVIYINSCRQDNRRKVIQ